jgi:hypothetical protein
LRIAETDTQRARYQDRLAIQRHHPQLSDSRFQRNEIEPRRLECHHNAVHAMVQCVDRSGSKAQAEETILRVG